MTSRRVLIVAAALLLAAVCAAYLPYVGRGFKQDDFAWIAGSRLRHLTDVAALFTRNTGFYRPVVALTFGLDELAFDMRPLGYGLTNLVLLLGCAAAIVVLARELGLSPGASLLAGGIWALNLQGINMAVVWLSGRTALVLVLFAVLAAQSLVAGRRARAALFTLLALLSKEEAVMLPVLLFAWASVDRGARGWRAVVRASWPLVLPVAIYAALRYASGAFGPMSAPAYYRFTLSPARVADNVVKYLDFSGSFPLALVVLAALLAAVVPRVRAVERRIVLLGAVWAAAGYAITVFLPIRSPLYACFPTVGVALAAAAVTSGIWSQCSASARQRLVVAGFALPFALLPVYWARNVRHARGAELSARVLADLKAASPAIPADAVVVLRDDPGLPVTDRLPAAFGTLYDIAVRDTLGRPDVQSWMDPPPDGWQMAGLRPPGPNAKKVVFALRGGRLVRIQ